MYVPLFEELTTSFYACKLRNSECVWINKLSTPASYIEKGKPWEAETINRDLGYAIPGEAFPTESFILSDFKIMEAEYYGGRGLEQNGGGVRCGNANDLQVKGIGKNPLAGKYTEKWHSYGAMSLRDAVCEAIYSEMLNTVLPYGAVTSYAILKTGVDVEYLDYGVRKVMPGASIVRDIAIRPAHFMRSPSFKPYPGLERKVFPEEIRTRLSVNSLYEYFNSGALVEENIKKFLSVTAAQLAYAKIMRISHGALGPSNFTLSGKWIDFGTVSTLPSGVNIMLGKGGMPFYREPYSTVEVLKEFVYTINKYSMSNLDFYKLESYYFKEFEKKSFHYAGRVFGLGEEMVPHFVLSADYLTLCKRLLSLLSSGTELICEVPETWSECDKINDWLYTLFQCLLDRNGSCQNTYSNEVSALYRIYRKCHLKLRNSKVSWRAFLTARVLITLKQGYLQNYFFRGRINNYVSESLHSGLRIQKLVDETIKQASWIYEQSTQIVTICQTDTVHIRYYLESETFQIFNHLNYHKATFGSITELAYWLTESGVLNCSSYDYQPYLNKVISLLQRIEEHEKE